MVLISSLSSNIVRVVLIFVTADAGVIVLEMAGDNVSFSSIVKLLGIPVSERFLVGGLRGAMIVSYMLSIWICYDCFIYVVDLKNFLNLLMFDVV